ncbi:major capsid protein [Gallid alphaherpesvirus 1]|uniref:Major capsid protein n=1 Tax=Infectious laryngotracheitis virus TaxID=10386 RepID=F5B4U7_ILTV|nr:major capsid protein [Gallid alphaherpesvirus 1]AEB97339.1 major capsid protein [Gallid alphaherpesvirus 1]AER28072.1 major capsid protein [Gallid alphaherpesvirus 1]AER28151.1 major capsid protein [Gallid alphaherpesvirus 1]AEW67791.1 major capsid protein [Gallid alphaherpesvirus 1]AEW67870.1 major capsid protein [Gallid alphaherpesvirus 1]
MNPDNGIPHNSHHDRAAFPRSAAPFVASGELLGILRENCHAHLYEWISREGDCCYRHSFDILLGSYFNTLTLTNFLETGLSVACICVKFPELRYADRGIIQFVVANPMIARSDCEVPSRPSFTYISKRWSRTTLSSSLVICAPALGLLSGESLDGTEISEFSRLQALNQLARNLKLTLDSFERGTINHVLRILIRKAPPLPLLRPMMAALECEREMSTVARANIISSMKAALCEDLFFIDKERGHETPDFARKLLALINCTLPSVTDARVTHIGPDGRLIEGVIVTTEAVKGLIAARLGIETARANVPAMYSEMVLSGNSLVTALLLGKTIRNFDEAAANLLSFLDGEKNLADFPEIPSNNADQVPTMSVKMSLLNVGDHLVSIEALERVYTRTGVPYPLCENVDLTFFFPLGLFKPAIDRYSTSEIAPAVGAPDYRQFPPTEMYFFNKDGMMVKLTFEDSLPTVAHPIAHGMLEALAELCQEPWVSNRRPAPMGFTIQRIGLNPPRLLMIEFLEAVARTAPAPYPDATLINRKNPDQFSSHTNPFLPLEVHPFYDVYRVAQDLTIPCDEPLFFPAEPITLAASRRLCNGDIPLPLSSVDFRLARGYCIAAGRHRLHPSTDAAIETTLSDVNYPLAFYVIEACIHGDELIFMESQRLVAQCINSYWHTSRGLAFINSYPMVTYIYHNMTGMIDRDCHSRYADVMGLLHALRETIRNYTLPAEPILLRSHEELNNLMTDPALFPPMIYDCDSILRARTACATRGVTISTFGERAPTVSVREYPAQVDFTVLSNTLNHGPAYTAGGRHEGGTHHDSEWTVLSKLFYYVFLPAVSRGRCCSAGVEFEMIYDLINTTRLPDTVDEMDNQAGAVDRGPLADENLAPESFNTLLANGSINLVDNEALVAFIAAARRRQAVHTIPLRVNYLPDPGFETIDSPRNFLVDGVLYNGIIMMNYAQYDATAIPSRYFYALPVNGFFMNRTIIEASHRANVNLTNVPEDLPLVPTFLGSEVYRSIRAPSYLFASRASNYASNSVVAYSLLAGYFKTSPVALVHQLKLNLHPGFALTVARQDRFAADQILFARRASESYYLGSPVVTNRPENDSLVIEISQPRGHIDMGLGFTASRVPAKINTVVTDMGNHCQNLFNARYPGQFRHAEVADFIASEITDNDSTALPRAQPPILLSYEKAPIPPCIERGQLATCEFLLTPVTADLAYFYTSANPRGRSSCIACTNCEDPCASETEKAMYDHSTPDAAHPSRATNNAWASQKYSVGDKMYNARRGFITASDFYSPLSKFMTPSRAEDKSRCLARLMRDSSAAISSVTGDTEYQFVAPPGANELVTDPCAMFQEAFPPLCSSDKVLFATYEGPNRASGSGARENHFAQYLIHDKSPIANALKTPCNTRR